MSKIKVTDIVLICLLVCVSLIPLLLFNKAGDTATVSVDGKVIYTLNLSTDSETVIDGICVVIVKDGAISVTDSQCRDKICENTGSISKAGETIVCVPNKLVVRVSGKAEVDAVAQ